MTAGNNPKKNVFDFFETKEFIKKEHFKLPDGNTELEFSSEPRHWYDEKYKKDNLIIEIKTGEKEYVWFIDEKKYVIIKGIKALGSPVTGHKVVIGRTGKSTNTRYTFTEVPQE